MGEREKGEPDRFPVRIRTILKRLLNSVEGEIVSRKWEEEMVDRVCAIREKMQTFDGGEEIIRRLKTGVIVRSFREGQRISLKNMDHDLGVDHGFTAFLENGFIGYDEVTPELRDGLARVFGLNREIVDLMFD